MFASLEVPYKPKFLIFPRIPLLLIGSKWIFLNVGSPRLCPKEEILTTLGLGAYFKYGSFGCLECNEIPRVLLGKNARDG
jgi:hypothetical protein